MSSNHKAPLAAFVVVAIACVVVLVTSSMRSYARDAWRTFAAPVISGLELIEPHHKPAPARDVPAETTSATVAQPAGPNGSPAHPAGTGRKAGNGGAEGGKSKAKHGGHHAAAGGSSQQSSQPGGQTGTSPVADQAPSAPAAPPSHSGSHGTSPSWSQGKHTGWSSHGSGPASHLVLPTIQLPSLGKHSDKSGGGHGSTPPAKSGPSRHDNGWTSSDTRTTHGHGGSSKDALGLGSLQDGLGHSLSSLLSSLGHGAWGGSSNGGHWGGGH